MGIAGQPGDITTYGPPVGLAPPLLATSIPAGGAIDWTLSGGAAEIGVARDVNNLGFGGCTASPGDTALQSFDDWANVRLDFQSSTDFADGMHLSSTQAREVDLQAAAEGSPDTDKDRVPNASDNCPQLPNRAQTDENLNGVGDVCELAVEGFDVRRSGEPRGDAWAAKASVTGLVPDLRLHVARDGLSLSLAQLSRGRWLELAPRFSFRGEQCQLGTQGQIECSDPKTDSSVRVVPGRDRNSAALRIALRGQDLAMPVPLSKRGELRLQLGVGFGALPDRIGEVYCGVAGGVIVCSCQ
jgi:hypothetical protein